jgi:VWFA-related protein
MKSRIAAALVGVALCAPSLLSQQPAQQPEATFRVQVDAVELDAAVTDAQGNPVADLTLDDFEVLEDGTPQAITSFRLVNIPFERAYRPPFAQSPIEPDVQSNDAGEGRLYLFALDQVAAEQALRTRRFLHRFIEQYFGANDLGAVVFLGQARAQDGQDFTNKPRLLLDAIDKFSGGFPSGAAEASSIATATGAAPPPPARNLPPTIKVRGLMSHLRKLTESVAVIHGRRKSILLFSDGFPVDMFKVIDYRGGVLSLEEEDAHAMVTAATRGNVTFYPIDPRGLTTDGDPGGEVALSNEALSGPTPTRSLRTLGEATGGFAVVSSNSFEQAFDRIRRENSSYYVLGYSSTNNRRDGRLRRVQTRVKRPGLQVRARSGYLSPIRPERSVTAAPSRSVLSASVAEALGSVVAVAGVPIKVFAAPYKGSQRDATVAIAIEIDASQLNLVEKNGEFVGAVEVSYVPTDPRQKVYPGGYHTANLSLTPEAYARLLQGGLRVLSEIHLAPNRYQVRVAAGNRTGRAGSVVYDLDVPDFTKEPLMMSGVSLTSRSLADVTTMRPKDPLSGLLPGPITAVREFPNGDEVALLADVYENVRNASPHTIDLTAELTSEDGRIVRRIADQRSTRAAKGRSETHRFVAELPLTDIAPGIYVIHVEARSSLGERPTASKDLLIRVR